jgi:hypothetical protein
LAINGVIHAVSNIRVDGRQVLPRKLRSKATNSLSERL